MSSGDWFKIITRKKTKKDQSKVKGATGEQTNGFKWRNQTHKRLYKLYNITASGNTGDFGISIEDIAAIWIQTAFRRFRARKTLRHLKGVKRLRAFTEGHFVIKQPPTTLSYLQSWTKIQIQIRARRACMVTEGHIRQKKLDNRLKLEAKLHGLEVEWSGGSETREEILSRMQLREEAAIKRERAMAYAFSHQWRANSGLNQGYEFGKGTWGWSWLERWIAARPWETRLLVQSASPNKPKSKPTSKVGKKISAQPTEEKIAIQEPNSKRAAPSHHKIKNGKKKQETQVP